jgi:hypothetical protein
MDLSKLPKLSETPRPASQPEPSPPPQESAPHPLSSAEGWVSMGIGIIFLVMFPRFLQWVASRLFGTNFNEFMLDGNIVPYPQVPEFWSDLGITLFSIVLIIEGIILALSPKRPLIWIAFALTTAAAIYNLIYVVTSYSRFGLAVVSAVAVVIGGYIAIIHWNMLKSPRKSNV